MRDLAERFGYAWMGAADGLRRRGGLRAWPVLRPGEAELAQIRQALEADRFDQVFATGSGLRQRAAAAIRDRPPSAPTSMQQPTKCSTRAYSAIATDCQPKGDSDRLMRRS